MMKLLLSILTSVTLLGCAGGTATTIPKDPAQTVYAAAGSYAAALQVAMQYVNLPRCGEAPPTIICSDSSTVAQIQKLDQQAFTSLEAAKQIVSLPQASPDVLAGTLAALNAAVTAFAQTTATLKVK